jgi:membrane protein YqaA with SNARE-associated domain
LKWTPFLALLRTTLPAWGGLGVCFAAFLDSSFLPLPLVTDLLVIALSSRKPVFMPYYAALAALGSLLGCMWIYFLARKGGQAYYHKTQGHPPGRIRKLVQQYPMACVFLPAIAPFPVPFKPFVIAQGVFEVPLTTFVVGTFVGRGCLFLAEGFLGTRYGAAAKKFVMDQKLASLAIALALIVLVLLIRHAPLFRHSQESQKE